MPRFILLSILFSLVGLHQAAAQQNVKFKGPKKEDIILPSYQSEEEILEQGNVRGFIWGLPKEIIRESEESAFADETKDGKNLYYVDTIRGIKSSINYWFEDNKLWRVQIFSEKRYGVPQARIEDMVKMKRDLDKRFGKPLEEKFTWKNDQNRNFPELWGYSVLGGELNIEIIWQDNETDVSLYVGMIPNDFRPVLAVTYEDRKAKLAKSMKSQRQAIEIIPTAPIMTPQ